MCIRDSHGADRRGVHTIHPADDLSATAYRVGRARIGAGGADVGAGPLLPPVAGYAGGTALHTIFLLHLHDWF